MNKKTLIVGAIIFALIIIQFIPQQKNNTPYEPKFDFIALEQPPISVQLTLQNSCYDCHSNKTDYPWYAKVAPVSWWINHHIEEGKEHLNFSEWGNYEVKRANHKLEETFEEVEEGEMPLNSYTLIHGDLSEEEKENLVTWFKLKYEEAEGHEQEK